MVRMQVRWGGLTLLNKYFTARINFAVKVGLENVGSGENEAEKQRQYINKIENVSIIYSKMSGACWIRWNLRWTVFNPETFPRSDV